MSELTTTSYAVLAHLAARPRWTAYELVQQLTRGFDLVWPRAERGFYTEPKRLAAEGYVKATTERAGRRTRTVYAITPKGRRALKDWFASRPAPPQLDSEPLIRVFFAELGTREDLLRAIAAVREFSEVLRDRLLRQISGYLEDGGPFPERWHVIALGARALLDHAEALDRWAREATREVERWQSTSATTAAERGRALLRDLLHDYGKPRPPGR